MNKEEMAVTCSPPDLDPYTFTLYPLLCLTLSSSIHKFSLFKLLCEPAETHNSKFTQVD